MGIYKKSFFYTALICSILSLSGWIYFQPNILHELDTSKLTSPSQLPEPELIFSYKIPKGSTLSSILSKNDIPAKTIHDIALATKPLMNLASLPAGMKFHMEKDEEGNLTSLTFKISKVERLKISYSAGVWESQKIQDPIEIRSINFSGVVESTLWESALQAKMDPSLISELAEIFAWEVDFAREVRVQDRWRLVVEQKIARGRPVGWGSILVAEYENSGTPYQAVLFRKDSKNIGYFTPDGKSLRKMFLKSPLKFGRITSSFNRRRFHPILKIRRPHLGVDYGAPIGTPIRAVGDGTVVYAKMMGAAGNTVRIRHNSTYETSYKHMNGFAKKVRSGTKVQQGQVIGYVGKTGLSTGPHLHFEFYQFGKYIDPLSKKFPSADPVPQQDLGEFKLQASFALSILPRWDNISIADKNISSSPHNEKL